MSPTSYGSTQKLIFVIIESQMGNKSLIRYMARGIVKFYLLLSHLLKKTLLIFAHCSRFQYKSRK